MRSHSWAGVHVHLQGIPRVRALSFRQLCPFSWCSLASDLHSSPDRKGVLPSHSALATPCRRPAVQVLKLHKTRAECFSPIGCFCVSSASSASVTDVPFRALFSLPLAILEIVFSPVDVVFEREGGPVWPASVGNYTSARGERLLCVCLQECWLCILRQSSHRTHLNDADVRNNRFQLNASALVLFVPNRFLGSVLWTSFFRRL